MTPKKKAKTFGIPVVGIGGSQNGVVVHLACGHEKTISWDAKGEIKDRYFCRTCAKHLRGMMRK